MKVVQEATSHMMWKFFNTQLINAGMPWEIREHLMGHKLKDRVGEAYFLADPEELKKIYLRYTEHLSVKGSSGKYSLMSSESCNDRTTSYVV